MTFVANLYTFSKKKTKTLFFVCYYNYYDARMDSVLQACIYIVWYVKGWKLTEVCLFGK